MIPDRAAGAPESTAAVMLRSAALTAVTLVGVVCAVAWPTVAVGLALLIVISVLAWRTPSVAFLAALLVSGGVGILKARLSAEQTPSPDALGAGLVDVLLVISFAGLMLSDRGRSLRAVWRAAGRAERVIWTLVFAWLVISVLQIPESGQLTRGIKGFRLTQAYVPLVLAGVAVFPVAGNREQLTKRLLMVFAVISGYAALRAAIGPAAWERTYALLRSQQEALGGLSRDVGSFNSPQDMISFVAPAGVFALIIGTLNARVRALAWFTFLLSAIAVVESYVRVGVVAMGVGAGVLALVVVLTKVTPRRTKLVAVAVALLVGAAGYGATLAAGGASRVTAARAGGLNHPLTDPSIEARWKRWKRAARTVLHHPLGTGVGTVGSATGTTARFDRAGLYVVGTGQYTDNSYLKVLVEQGPVVGLLFIFGVIGSALLLGRKLARAGPLREPLAVAGLCAFVAFLTICFLGEYIEWPGKVLAWTLLGIGLWHGYGTVPGSVESSSGAADVTGT
jgi:hypothetical protein